MIYFQPTKLLSTRTVYWIAVVTQNTSASFYNSFTHDGLLNFYQCPISETLLFIMCLTKDQSNRCLPALLTNHRPAFLPRWPILAQCQRYLVASFSRHYLAWRGADKRFSRLSSIFTSYQRLSWCHVCSLECWISKLKMFHFRSLFASQFHHGWQWCWC